MAATVRSSYAALADLPTQYAGAAQHWLSHAERARWHELRSNERRGTFLGGRIVAKRLVKRCLADLGQRLPENAEVHIESSGAGRGQRPRIFVGNQPLDWALSIAHTARGVLAAVAREPGVTLGVDLVVSASVDTERIEWCFSPAERQWLACRADHTGAERLWAMKEALYKACHEGEGFSPCQIEVVPEPCYPWPAAPRGVRIVQGWRVDGQFASLVVVDPPGERVNRQRETASLVP